MRWSNARVGGVIGTAFAMVVLLAAGCGGGDSEPSEGEAAEPTSTTVASAATAQSASPDVPTEACGLVSDEEVSEILGKPLVSQELLPGFCEYVSEESGTGGAEVVVVDATALGCAVAFELAELTDAAQVDGLGSEARFKAGDLPELAVCIDEAVMLTVAIRADAADPLAVATDIARLAETRIR